MLICQMEDDHLLCTIRLYCRKLQQAQAVIANTALLDPITATLSSLCPEDTARQAKASMRAMHERLMPYLAEAALRGLSVTTELQAAYGRSTAIPCFVPTLVAGNDDSYDIEDEDDDRYEEDYHSEVY